MDVKATSLKVIDGGNQPKPWACCDKFRECEELEFIAATETGYAIIAFETQVLFNMLFCPFCGTLLPTVNKSGDEW